MNGIAEAYLLEREVSRGYASNLRRTAKKLDAAGITPANIDGARVSMWLSSLKANGLSAVSIASERRSAITLWKYAIEVGLINQPIRGVLKPKVARRVTRAFSREDLTRAVNLFSTCDFGAFQSGCSKNLWLSAWVRFVYETGARFTDAYNLEASALVPGGVAFVASKTGQPVVRGLTEETHQILSALVSKSTDGSVFRWAISRRHAFAILRQAFKSAGLQHGRTQWLRRSGATHCEMERKGGAKEYLAHATTGLAEKHYIDYTQMVSRFPAPPAISGKGCIGGGGER